LIRRVSSGGKKQIINFEKKERFKNKNREEEDEEEDEHLRKIDYN